MTRPCLALLLVLNVCTVAAQEHPFLSRFALTEGLGFVQLDWTMTAGNTCEGIDIYRSLDGSNFETVGTIPGICGDINSPVPFSWTDQSAPELTTVYYRLRLGLNGFSSVQRIDLRYLVSRAQWVYPVPAVDRCTLLLQQAHRWLRFSVPPSTIKLRPSPIAPSSSRHRLSAGRAMSINRSGAPHLNASMASVSIRL